MDPTTLFISYAHVDKALVRQLVKILRDNGYEPWFDHNLIPGLDWKDQLEKRIKQCNAFVFAMTPESVISEWCLWELRKAIEIGKPIIPVLFQTNVTLPAPIKHLQYVDFSDGPTSRATGKLNHGLRVATTVPLQSAWHLPQNPRGQPSSVQTTQVTEPQKSSIELEKDKKKSHTLTNDLKETLVQDIPPIGFGARLNPAAALQYKAYEEIEAPYTFSEPPDYALAEEAPIYEDIARRRREQTIRLIMFVLSWLICVIPALGHLAFGFPSSNEIKVIALIIVLSPLCFLLPLKFELLSLVFFASPLLSLIIIFLDIQSNAVSSVFIFMLLSIISGILLPTLRAQKGDKESDTPELYYKIIIIGGLLVINIARSLNAVSGNISLENLANFLYQLGLNFLLVGFLISLTYFSVYNFTMQRLRETTTIAIVFICFIIFIWIYLLGGWRIIS